MWSAGENSCERYPGATGPEEVINIEMRVKKSVTYIFFTQFSACLRNIGLPGCPSLESLTVFREQDLLLKTKLLRLGSWQLVDQFRPAPCLLWFDQFKLYFETAGSWLIRYQLRQAASTRPATVKLVKPAKLDFTLGHQLSGAEPRRGTKMKFDITLIRRAFNRQAASQTRARV